MLRSRTWSIPKLSGRYTYFFKELPRECWEDSDIVYFFFVKQTPLKKTCLDIQIKCCASSQCSLFCIQTFKCCVNIYYSITKLTLFLAALWTQQPHWVTCCRILPAEILTKFRKNSCYKASKHATKTCKFVNIRAAKICLFYNFVSFLNCSGSHKHSR